MITEILGRAGTGSVDERQRCLGAFLARLGQFVRQWQCGHRGAVLKFDAHRMWLDCSCGHQSPGWDVNGARPVVRFAGCVAPTVRTEVVTNKAAAAEESGGPIGACAADESEGVDRVAIIIDFGGKEPRKETAVSAVTAPDKPATLKPADYQSCKHGRAVIDEEKRTVTCSDCGAVVDPFFYILLLYGYYETRVDRRLAGIQEFERQERERCEREAKRKREPRRRKIERRAESAERAAYNEYQAKLLQARAERQRQLVERLDSEISAMAPESERARP